MLYAAKYGDVHETFVTGKGRCAVVAPPRPSETVTNAPWRDIRPNTTLLVYI